MAKGNRRNNPISKWDDLFYVRVYELRRSGIRSKASVAKALGVTRKTFCNWLDNNAALQDAWERGDRKAEGTFSFEEFVYGRLPPKLQSVWEDIQNCDDSPDGTLQLAELMGGVSVKARQRLFLYALCRSAFSVSAALHAINLPKRTLNDWCLKDPEFGELLSELHDAKKDFFEEALVDLVNRRETSAVIFANKTVNSDRGYGESKKIKLEGEVRHQHQHEMITFDVLETLPVDVKKAVLDAYRAYQAKQAMPADVVEGQLAAPVEV